ncbi:MAG: histidine phosphatase family protein [Piscinibacter sp.]|nr:histidine phosphatase family protein [Piscinibacter sp.]
MEPRPTSPRRAPTGLRRRTLLAALAGWTATGAANGDEAAVLRELRAGGALLLRHTQTTPGVGDPPGWTLGRCASQRNLDDSGIAHARRIGAWFAAQGLEVSQVRNSPWCRTRDTARLAFGRHDDWPALGNIFEDASNAPTQVAEVRRFVGALPAGELVVLVSHGVTIRRLVGPQVLLAQGAAVLVRGADLGVVLPLQID